MPRVHWRLKYDPEVTAILYDLRERGSGVRTAIRELMYQPEPWTGARMAGEMVTWYEFEIEGYLVGFGVSTDPEDKEPTLKIYYVLEGG